MYDLLMETRCWRVEVVYSSTYNFAVIERLELMLSSSCEWLNPESVDASGEVFLKYQQNNLTYVHLLIGVHEKVTHI